MVANISRSMIGLMTSRQDTTPPRLLVSVRNVEEAREIRRSPCAIVDVKEPANGPLGRANASVQQEVAEVCSGSIVSFALGEVAEWCPEPVPAATYLKLGLAGLGGEPGWMERWLQVRNEVVTSAKARWVAVSYADHAKAVAPPPIEVLEAAIHTDCVVFLLDTFDKSADSLFDCLSVSELVQLRARAETAGILFAIAGQLRVHHAESIAEVRPDIVGIRGAACACQNRESRIRASAVARFATAIGSSPSQAPSRCA